MSNPVLRELSYAQHARLDVMDTSHPGAVVVGWMGYGPLIRLPDGGYRRINPHGRVNAVTEAKAHQALGRAA
jgi:hypothetical protein